MSAKTKIKLRFSPVLFILLVSLSGNNTLAQTDSVIAEQTEQRTSQDAINQKNRDDDTKCVFLQEDKEWIDRMREGTHRRVCLSVLWVDSLFGDDHDFNDDNFSGKVSLGFRQDEEEGFDPKVRVKIRARLPNVSDRLNAFVGRVDEDSYISNTEATEDSISERGLRSADNEEDEWLIGLGYRNPNKNSNGFDFSVGAKLSSGIAGYAKLAHRHLFQVSPRNSWRTTQTVFWRRDDRFGASSTLDFTHILDENDIFEWDTSVKYTETEKNTEWITSGIWHHSFTPKKGISSRLYVRGETERDVDIPEFGTSFTYIRPFLRPWFYVETGVDFRWENEIRNRDYKSKIRFSLQFQMLLGDYYRRN